MARKRTISLRTKISMTTAAMVIVIGLVLGSFSIYNQLDHIRTFEKRFLQDSVRSSATISYTIMPSVVSNNFVSMNSLVSYYAGRSDRLYILVVDNNNRIVANSEAERIGGTFKIPSAYKTEKIGEGTVRRFTRSGREAVEISYPVRAGDLVVGNVVMGLNMDWLEEETAVIRRTIMVSAGMVIALISLGILLASELAKRVSGPIQLLTRAAEKVARGDYNQEIHVQSNDEVGTLADTFNVMLQQLRSAQTQLVEKARLKDAQHIAQIGDWEWDIEHDTIYWSEELYRIYGCEPYEITPDFSFVVEAMHPKSRDAFIGAIDAALKAGRPFEMEYTFFRKDGGEAVLHAIGQVHYDSNGAPVRMVGTVQDVTERRNLQARLEEKTAEQNTILENSLVGIAFLRERRFVWFNSKIEQMFGYSKAEMAGLTTEAFYPSHEGYEQLGEEAYPLLASGKSYTTERMMERKDGSLFWCSLAGKAVDQSDLGKGSIWILQDITETRRAEEQIRASLREKEILLKEVHHRVKNNLQVVSSMLSLQSKYLEDQKAKAMFEDSQRRVESMSLIHEKLYRSRDLAKIGFREYVADLVENVTALNKAESGRIEIREDIGEVILDVNKGIPCGLIINELLSNALRHAFPSGRRGVVVVRMQCDDSGRISLVVSDNGVGFPGRIDFRNTKSLGMQLVIALVGQLEGAIELDSREGTAFVVTFYA